MMNYNNEYKTYYENLRGKVNNVKLKSEGLSSIEKEIIPRRVGIQAKGHSGYYRNNRSLNSRETSRYGRNKISESRKFGYIDKAIFKLIGALLLVLISFVFKISPNERVKTIYQRFDSQINKTYDLDFTNDTLNKLGFDVDKLEDLIGKIENKTSEVIKEIMD